MAKDYVRKYRGCPSLTPKRKADSWRRSRWARPSKSPAKRPALSKTPTTAGYGGKALRLNEDSPDIPYSAPRQPDETDQAWFKRKYLRDWDRALLEDLSLTVMRTVARKRVDWMRRMDQRALEDRDMYANAWVLERKAPQHYALVTTNRKEVDAKVEVTHKQQAQLLTEAFA